MALTDLALSGATRAANVSASGAAALVSLAAHPGLSVTELGRRVGLTQSAAARMVDSLEAVALVERRPSAVMRQATTVHPTRAGRQAVRRLLAARGTPLTDVVAALDEDEQQQLGDLLTKVLTRVYEQVGAAQYICRLCDRGSCTTQSATCPVGQAELERERHR